MKKALLTLAICFTTIAASFAQTDPSIPTPKPPRAFKHQIGVNMNTLFHNLFGITTDSSAVPTMLTYRIAKGKLGYRLGIGGRYKHDVQQEDGFADKFVTDRKALSIRLGLEYQTSIHPRWLVSFGADANYLASVYSTINDSGFDKIETTKQLSEYGFGPSLGIYFSLSKRLMLSTEASLTGVYSIAEDGLFFANLPLLQDELIRTTSTTARVTLPTYLYLVYQF